MQLDIGFTGLGILLVLSLVFGTIVQLVGRAGWAWEWAIAAIAWFAGGFIASEVFFGKATVDEIQPIIDGLAFDESLLGGILVGVPVAIVVRWFAGGAASRGTPAA